MSENNKPRRDFIKLSAMTLGGVGAASLAIPFISSMNPGKDTLALASTEIDLAPLEEGQSLTVIWRGKPVFIKHRTQKEIEEAKNISLSDLIDAEDDSVRVQKDKWFPYVCNPDDDDFAYSQVLNPSTYSVRYLKVADKSLERRLNIILLGDQLLINFENSINFNSNT